MRKNIVLIGLSGCGKSTVGAALSYRLRMHFVDMDAYIEHKEGMSIRKIFEQKGEEAFRRMETEAAKALSESGGKIIATGGGAVLNPQNMAYLKQNAVVVFLDRTPEAILKKINLSIRPLLAADPSRLYKLDRERRPLYEKYADITVEGLAKISWTVTGMENALRPYIRVPARKMQPKRRKKHRFSPRH